jgi:hypothetical protein
MDWEFLNCFWHKTSSQIVGVVYQIKAQTPGYQLVHKIKMITKFQLSKS